MTLYKFLDAHDRGPFTGAPWAPGMWMEAERAAPCRDGIHGFRAPDVSHWLAASLWELEIDGEVIDTHHKVVGRRGRLVRRLDDYPLAARELAEVGVWRCVERAVEALRAEDGHELADLFLAARAVEDVLALGDRVDESSFGTMMAALAVDAAHFGLHGDHAQSPFVAACSAGNARAGAGGDQREFDAGYATEREFQSRWLVQRLALG